jgi:hypothetical protein
MADFHFVTDRLAIGNVTSRGEAGFCAVVSVLATERPGTLMCEVKGAPDIPGEIWLSAEAMARSDADALPYVAGNTHVLHIDLADGESHSLGQPRDRDGNQVPSRGLEDYLDDATSFIAAHIRRGCVLVHCVAGTSRSVAVAVAYFCRYAGMDLYEAKNLVFGCVPGAKLWPCFEEAIKRWLRLDELERQGPRKAFLRRLTQQGEEMGMYEQEDGP